MADLFWRGEVIEYACEEYEHVEIDPAALLGDGHRLVLNSEIDGRDVVRASFRSGRLAVQATSYVGVIPLNDRVVLRVRPRVPISSLTRMVLDTGHDALALTALRDYSGHQTASDWAMDLYARTLLDRVDDLIDRGLHRVYVRRDSEGSFPRGRIDLSRTASRFASHGVQHKVAFSWFERTADTPVNRCVKAALLRIHRHLSRDPAHPKKGYRAMLGRLSGQLRVFADVKDDHVSSFLSDPLVLGHQPLPDPRSYYRPVLDVSLLILREQGIALELGGEDVSLGSLLIDTNELFESFVRVSLARTFRARGWPAEVLDGNSDGYRQLYDVPAVLPSALPAIAQSANGTDARAQPDVVFRLPDGTVPLVAEVKNTAHGKGAVVDLLPVRTEVNQAVTYALRYGLPRALLIHPWVAGTKGMVYAGRIGAIDVYDYRLDLSSEDLDPVLDKFADEIAAFSGGLVARMAHSSA